MQYQDIRMAKAQLKQPFLAEQITAYQRYIPPSQQLRYYGRQIKSLVFEPTPREYMLRYGLTDTARPFTGQTVDRYQITTLEQLYGGKPSARYRDIRFAMEEAQRLPSPYEIKTYKPTYGVPSRYALFAETLAMQKQMQFKLGLMKDIHIKTETKIVVHPERPWEAAFKTQRIGRDIFSKGKITLKGETAEIIGKTYWKLSPENIFYQKTPFKSVVSSKYIGDVGGYTVSKTAGASVPYSEIKAQLYGYTFKDARTGVYQPIMKKPTLFKGTTIQKDIFAGESFITEKGFLEQYKMDISLARSRGVFRGKIVSGTFEDIVKIYKPKLKAKVDYSGGVAKFDVVKPSTILDELRLPGGISAPVQTTIELYHPFQKMYTKPLTFAEIEAFDVGVSVSLYWKGVAPQLPQIKTTPILAVIPQIKTTPLVAEVSKLQIKQAKELLNIKTATFEQMLSQAVTPISIQDIVQTPLTIQTSLQQQEQQQAQQQMQKQIQLQLTQQVLQTPLVIQPVVAISPPIITPATVPPTFTYPPTPIVEVPTPPTPPPPGLLDLGEPREKKPKEKQAYNVLVKDRYYVKGKKVQPEIFKEVNKVPLTREDALSYGATVADQSRAMSFKIVQTTGKPKEPKINIGNWAFLKDKFRQKNNTYIEKRAFAIDTMGEIQDISALGWIAQQPKKIIIKKAKVIKKPMVIDAPMDIDYDYDMFDINKAFKKMFGGFNLGF